LSPQDIYRTVDEHLADSETSVFDSDDESSVIDYLPVREFLTTDESENEDDDAQSGSGLPSVAHVLLLHGRTWKIMLDKENKLSTIVNLKMKGKCD
jgi:hypothetical protein